MKDDGVETHRNIEIEARLLRSLAVNGEQAAAIEQVIDATSRALHQQDMRIERIQSQRRLLERQVANLRAESDGLSRAVLEALGMEQDDDDGGWR